MCLSLCIVVLLHIMYVAINFHDKRTLMAVEVNNKTVNHLLAAEMKTTQFIAAELLQRTASAAVIWRRSSFARCDFSRRTFCPATICFTAMSTSSPLPFREGAGG